MLSVHHKRQNNSLEKLEYKKKNISDKKQSIDTLEFYVLR